MSSRLKPSCIAPGCDRPQRGKHGYCNMHRQRVARAKRRAENPRPPKHDIITVEPTKTCERCGASFQRRHVGGSGASYEDPSAFAKRKYCSPTCSAHAALERRWLDTPYRMLVAQTCAECGELLMANRFVRSNRGFAGKTCRSCIGRRYEASLAKERRRARWQRNYELLRRSDHPRHRHGYQWTGPELEMCDRTDLTAREVATAIGRTIRAVQRMRYLIRVGDPKVHHLLGAVNSSRAAS